MAVRGRLRCVIWISGLCLLSACSGAPAASEPSSPVVAGGQSPAAGISITVSTTNCGTGWRNATAGLQTFQIHNASPSPVDVSLTNALTGGVYAEIEAIGPDTTRPLQVQVGSGTYAFLCDVVGGSRVTGPTTVVRGKVADGAAVAPPDLTQTLAALTAERTYITNGLARVAQQVSVLEADLAAGDLDTARSDWLSAHLTFERLGSAYGMFSSYDDTLNGSPDGLAGGVNDPSFTGFYRIEYGLWHGQSAAQLLPSAQLLYGGIQSLRTAYPGMILYPQAALSDLALRTHEILEHTIRFQLSGADDFGSGTTLATAVANIEATQAQLGMLKPLLSARYSGLSATDNWLGRLELLVTAAQTASGWTPVDKLTTSQREDINSAAAETVQLLAPIAVMFETDPLP